MSSLWYYLFRDNPMQIETLRAVRRFTVAGAQTPSVQRKVTMLFFGILFAIYAWFIVTILAFRDDMSEMILWFEFVSLTLLVPGSLYAAISGERERLTWDSLILTRLSPARILTGKLLWRLGLAGLILLVLFPPLLLTHLTTRFTADYTLGNLLWVQVCIVAWCVFLAAFTLWVSARTKRSVVTLSVVTVSLLTALILLPGLVSVFGVNVHLSYRNPSRSIGDYQTIVPTEYPQMAYVGSLIVHLSPAYVIGALDNLGLQHVERDYWRDLIVPGLGIYNLLPFIYLLLAAFCVVGTLKALGRLGLPTGGAR